jgi:hypothetical protein
VYYLGKDEVEAAGERPKAAAVYKIEPEEDKLEESILLSK